jgi:hypothetical protein
VSTVATAAARRMSSGRRLCTRLATRRRALTRLARAAAASMRGRRGSSDRSEYLRRAPLPSRASSFLYGARRARTADWSWHAACSTRCANSSGGIVRRQHSFEVLSAITASALLFAVVLVGAQPRAETFTADATVARANGTVASARLYRRRPVVRDRGGTRRADCGGRKGGRRRATCWRAARTWARSRWAPRRPRQSAYVRSTGSGRLITLVTAQADPFRRRRSAGREAEGWLRPGLVLLDVDPSKPGHGEWRRPPRSASTRRGHRHRRLRR